MPKAAIPVCGTSWNGMLMSFPLCHEALLPGDTSGCEAGVHGRAEPPALASIVINVQLKITLQSICLEANVSSSETWEPVTNPLEFGLKSFHSHWHFL